MLVLSRKMDQDILIEFEGVTAVVKVVEIRGDKVRLGFSAPREVRILRQELARELEQAELGGEG